MLKNPHRVAEKQRKYIQFVGEGRYYPILPERKIGICFLKDNQPGTPHDYLYQASSDTSKPVVAAAAAPEPAAAPSELAPVPEEFHMDNEDELSLKKHKEE